jgi:hypothetical protein
LEGPWLCRPRRTTRSSRAAHTEHPFGQDNTDRGYGIFDKAQGKPGGVERHRSFGDPVSFFDGPAKSSLPGKEALSFSGPHAFQGRAAQHMSEGVAAQANPDGSVSITE